MTAALAALLLVLGQTPYVPGSWPYQPGPGGASAAVLDVRMTTCGTTPVVARGGPLTVTRAAAQNYVCADGVMRSAPANTLPITEQGAQIFGAGTNTILQSQALDNGTWSKVGSATPPTVTADQAVAPDGTVTAEQVSYPAVNGAGYSVLAQAWTATAVPWTLSGYVKGQSGAGTIFLNVYLGGTTFGAACNYVSTAWTRCKITQTLTAASWTAEIGVDKTVTGDTDQGAQIVYVWGVQFEAAPFASPYQPTTTTAVSWPATVVTAPNALAAAQEQNFCVSVNASSGNQGFFVYGAIGAASVANSSALGASGLLPFFNVFDNSAAYKQINSGSVSIDSAKHAISGCVSGATSVSVFKDNISLSGGVSGSGVGVQSALASVGIGSDSAGGYNLNGYMSRFMLCNSPNQARCHP
jgi:hypothetical protein